VHTTHIVYVIAHRQPPRCLCTWPCVWQIQDYDHARFCLFAATYPDAHGHMNEGVSREQWGDVSPSAAWLRQVTAGWQNVFLLAVFVDLLGIVLYGALASGQRQPWAPRSRGGAVGDDE
jgi:hypothetical protein